MWKWFLLILLVRVSCWAAPRPVERQVENMRVVLAQADDAYYNRHESMMSDASYDALREKYDRLLAQYPELADAEVVGAPVDAASEKVAHAQSVLSLQKAYTDDEVRAFVQQCGMDVLYCVEPKIDGVSLVLYYRDGMLAQALTRGDGQEGVDVSSAVLASGAVPVQLNESIDMVVRGEFFMPNSAFVALNNRRKKEGELPLKSPRNTAAGTLRLKDLAEVARRGLQFQTFELITAETIPLTHAESLVRMHAVGLPVIESVTVAGSQVLKAVDSLNRRRSEYVFQSDGVVIKVDDRSEFKRLGATSHHPRGALARKYRQEPKTTRLLNVTWSCGETGKLTPVAHFEPVEINGATVQRATLHNWAHIQALDLKIGDWIQVIRAGGTTPEITGNVPERRTGSERPISPPPEV